MTRAAAAAAPAGGGSRNKRPFCPCQSLSFGFALRRLRVEVLMMLGPPSFQLSLQRRAATVRWDGGAGGERLIHFEMTRRHEKVNPGNALSRPSSSSSRIDATGCSLRDRCLFLCPPRSIEHFFVSCRRPSLCRPLPSRPTKIGAEFRKVGTPSRI